MSTLFVAGELPRDSRGDRGGRARRILQERRECHSDLCNCLLPELFPRRRLLLGASDATHLERATSLRRSIVTCDHDFLQMLHDLSQTGARHPGLLFVLPETRVGEAIRAIVLVAEIYELSELESSIEWIP